jgi:catechol 2,3-dioxygenase-like lactoylglutathione lyase family enzyme
MFNKLFANCLLVNDFDKSLAFYKDTLGLEVNTIEGKFADFKLEGTSLAIFEKEAATSMFSKEHMGQGGGVILAFQVEDVQKACDELKSKGIEIFEGPKTTPWGQIVAYFKDPDGNIWEVSAK